MARKPKTTLPDVLPADEEADLRSFYRSRITDQHMQIQVLQAACLVARTEIAEARAQGRCQLPAWAKTLEILDAALQCEPEQPSQLTP
jgi:hypothetical protein